MLSNSGTGEGSSHPGLSPLSFPISVRKQKKRKEESRRKTTVVCEIREDLSYKVNLCSALPGKRVCLADRSPASLWKPGAWGCSSPQHLPTHAPISSFLFLGTETVRVCTLPVVYPFISSVYTCKVEHFVYVLLVTPLVRCALWVLIMFLSTSPRKVGKMRHCSDFSPQVVSLYLSFLQFTKSKVHPKPVAHAPHSPQVIKRWKALPFKLKRQWTDGCVPG